MASLTVVVNTCCRGPAGRLYSSGKQPYMERLWLLRNVTIPLYTKWMPELFRQVIVVGEFEEGEGYTYVHCPSTYKSCVDALAQRDAGFDAVENTAVQWILFHHDDHVWDPTNQLLLPETADVLSPSRWTHGRSLEKERLNDGTYHAGRTSQDVLGLGYLNGHACLMRPHVFRHGFRWSKAEKIFQWDTSVTQVLQRQETRIRYAPELKVWDMERNACPWE